MEHAFFHNVTIITGASSGIGRELALQLSQQHAFLALVARRETQLLEVAEECTRAGAECLVIPLDITSQENCHEIVTRTVKRFGKIDTLINNAGIGMHSRVEDVQNLEIYQSIMQVNFFGGLWCTYYSLPYLKETRGRIVAISSYAGLFSSPFASGYAASKHAMIGFLDSLRVELEGTGVSVTIVHPTWVKTGISSRLFDAQGNSLNNNLDHETNSMSLSECARRIIKAVEKRKRQAVFGIIGKLGLWLRTIAPKMVDEEGKRELK